MKNQMNGVRNWKLCWTDGNTLCKRKSNNTGYLSEAGHNKQLNDNVQQIFSELRGLTCQQLIQLSNVKSSVSVKQCQKYAEKCWLKCQGTKHDPSQHSYTHQSWGPFLEGPEKFSHPESHSKISNLMITELFYFTYSWHIQRFWSVQKVSGSYASLSQKVSGAFVCNKTIKRNTFTILGLNVWPWRSSPM